MFVFLNRLFNLFHKKIQIWTWGFFRSKRTPKKLLNLRRHYIWQILKNWKRIRFSLWSCTFKKSPLHWECPKKELLTSVNIEKNCFLMHNFKINVWWPQLEKLCTFAFPLSPHSEIIRSLEKKKNDYFSIMTRGKRSFFRPLV